MTRNPSVDYTAAHRDYVFGKEPISLSDLAVKYGCSRAALATKAAGEEGEMSWFEQRKEFEARIGEKTLLALADEWAAVEAENRKKRMETANAVLDQFTQALADKTAKITSKDALEWVQLMRAEFEDMRNVGQHPDMIDGEAVEMTEAQAKEAYAEAMKYLGAGKNGTPAAE